MIVILLILVDITSQELITNSQIELCDQTQNNDCSDIMFIQLTLENSQNISTQQIQINQTIVNNNTLQLQTPINISIIQTPVYAYYPIQYFKDYNSKPYEFKIPLSADKICDDNWFSNSPTCEFQNSEKNKIQDSQGFCCSCNSQDLIQQNDDNDDLIRDNICNKTAVTSIAFCLRQSPLWYSSYKISQFIIQYNITISISYSLNLTKQFNLGSEIQEQKDQNIFAKIVSGFSPQQQPPVLENLYFMKPSLPIDHNRVQIGSEAYMLIPQELVGQGDCNKIGVSYSSFKNQTQKCKVLMQSCLQNQIEDLYQNDLELIANNSQPQYLIFKYGQFKQTNINDDLFLQYSFNQSMTTSIELQINNANDITYIKDIKESEKGQIDLVEIHNFSAASGFGLLYAQITNIGEISCKFQSFLNCSNNTQTIYSIDLSLDPQKSKIVQQDINFSTQIRESNSCNFSLLNNEGSLLDWKTIYFDELMDNNQKSNSSFNFKENTCDSKCSPFFDIYCYFQYNCESQIITFFTVLSGIFITICFCCIYLGYKKKLSCCQFKKQLQNNTSPLESVLYQQNKELKRRIKLSDSYQESYCQQQILSVSQDEVMYLNLALGTDPISNELQCDASFEVLATYQKKELIKLSVKRNSQFVRIFKQIYGLQNIERNVKKYLAVKVESISLFSSLLTEFPLFTIY
ncbi:unnamed protein product [Paramecium sonneborni]|uniref:Generative cell specific-1/HAP2 domain-containing protein n=1 Tax=Paramecium sonneborni TaxID=65129 RepID=A0A8S1R7V4_9CILI|nr:unnamed protein product [Paramecium sonneborni]